MKVIFILSDALRYDYLKYMPFLKEMSTTELYIEKVKPGIGFCEISEYVTGLPSMDNGNLFQLTFSGNYQKPILGKAAKVNTFINHIPKIRRYAQKRFDQILQKNMKQFQDPDVLRVRYNIPLNLLNLFVPTESKFSYDSYEFFGDKNLFHQLREMGKTYDISDFVVHNKIHGSDEDRLQRLQNKIGRKELKDFTLLYIGKGEIAHRTGTQSQAFHQILTSYDKKLGQIKEQLDHSYKDQYRFIVLGDHGMVDIHHYMNVQPVLRKISKRMDLKLGENFVYFIDSTALRIWMKEKDKINEYDELIKKYIGKYLDPINLDKPVYGDLIYVLKPGTVFFPDFFNVKKNKGMHGYLPLIDEQKGLCLVIQEKKTKTYQEIDLHCIKEIIIQLLQK